MRCCERVGVQVKKLRRWNGKIIGKFRGVNYELERGNVEKRNERDRKRGWRIKERIERRLG
jgi:hypothetical protein